MRLPFLVVAMVLARSLAAAQADLQTADAAYPTVDRVQFVEACIRDHTDRPHQEMLYKCSCAMDNIIEQFSYDDYVEASTAYFAGQIAGERGVGVRESTIGRNLAQRYQQTYALALKACFIAQ